VREKVLRYILDHKLLRAGDRVTVAVSGGADSVALLRLLIDLRSELGIVVSVAHFNHRLRGEASDADEAFAAGLAKQHDLEFFSGRGDVRDYALTTRASLEAAARELRYRWLASVAESNKLNTIATGHTLDDQAETVLLKFLRGAGTRGLAGIFPEIATEAKDPCARIIRPLLEVTRAEVEQYLTALEQPWREDESNLDRRFARNRVRHELLPLLEREHNPNVRQVLSDSADIARAEEEYWQTLVDRELATRLPSNTEIPQGLKPGTGVAGHATVKAMPFQSSAGQCLSLTNFPALPLALQRRLLKRLLESQRIEADFQHAEKLRRCAVGELRKAELSFGWLGVRRHGYLEFVAPQPEPPCVGYQYTLPVPGEVHITEIGRTLRLVPVPLEFAREISPTDRLINSGLLGSELTVRNWRPGDRYWPAHSKSEEKLKRLFSEQHIPAEQRQSWPLVLCDSQIVWVHGFPVARAFAWAGRGDALQIELLS
jgi:tRNA(Ile)-lysidine synthase